MNNFLKRTVFGALYVGVIVAGLFIEFLMPVVCIFAMLAMLIEFLRSFSNITHFLQYFPMILAGILVFLASWAMQCESAFPINGVYAMVAVAFVFLASMFYVQLFLREKFFIEHIGMLLLGFFWICLPFTILPPMLFATGKYDGIMALSFFSIIWGSDVGAYLLGSALGQRPGAKRLAPEISPKKSWWGVLGAFILAAAAAVALNLTGVLDLPLAHSIAISALICFASICGDLFESVWKRHAGIKDSGRIIPGHGGMLDRLDSALFAFPIAYLYLTIFDLI